MIDRLSIYVHPNNANLPPKIWGGFFDDGVPCIFYGTQKSITIAIKERDYLMKKIPEKTAKGYKNVVYDASCIRSVCRSALQVDLISFAHYVGVTKSPKDCDALHVVLGKFLQNASKSVNAMGRDTAIAVLEAMQGATFVDPTPPKPKKLTTEEKQTARAIDKVLKLADKAASKLPNAPTVDLSW